MTWSSCWLPDYEGKGESRVRGWSKSKTGSKGRAKDGKWKVVEAVHSYDEGKRKVRVEKPEDIVGRA